MKHARQDYDRFQDPSGKIPDDEPVLLIRGQDAAAPRALRAWADINDEIGGDSALSSLVREHANLMEEWQRNVAMKIADL